MARSRYAVEHESSPPAGNASRRGDRRKGATDDGTHLAYCQPCLDRKGRKRRPGMPAVTILPALASASDRAATIAAQSGHCFRCGQPGLDLLVVTMRVEW